MAQLTQREREVVLLLSDGLAPKEIARRLGTQPSTVRQQVFQAKQKSGCRTVIQLAVRVARERQESRSKD